MKLSVRSVWLHLSFVGLVVCAPAFAQTRPAQDTAPPPNGTVLLTPDEDYRLSPGDTLEIVVEDAPELSGTFRCSAAGEFELPVLGTIKAQGKTADELARLIFKGLREARYLKQPFVKVTVKQFSSHNYFIQGAVKQAGVYQTEGRPSLIKLISLAGGLQENHGPIALILRPRKAETPAAPAPAKGPAADDKPAPEKEEKEHETYDLIKVNLNAMYLQGRFEQNFRVEPGDIVHIPPANVFYVAGEVQAPGSFAMKEGTTLRQAISLAQGTTFKAKMSRGIIFRDDPETGRRQELHVNVGAVMNGKSEDIIIQPNDVVIIGNSRFKSVSSAFLTALGVNSARLPIRY